MQDSIEKYLILNDYVKTAENVLDIKERIPGPYVEVDPVFEKGFDDLIKKSYETLNLITYFTTGEDESRAWTITKGWNAPMAGTAIHTDFKDKFIRAEVVYCDDLLASGSYAVAREKAERVWAWIEPFAAYGFNKAHSASYGRVAYQTAYMKANYPVEYMTAVLTAEAGNIETVAVMVNECKRLGIEVLPPDINESFSDFTALPSKGADTIGGIRFGLSTIKNFGEGVGASIIAERKQNGPFTSLSDFLRRITNTSSEPRTF
jgi:hypothetical protein